MTDSTVLVDTSAWVEFFRRDGDRRCREVLSGLLDENRVATCGIILAEILKGARSEEEYRELEERLETLVYLPTPEEIWRRMGRTASLMLRKGTQIPTADLLIGTIASENRLPLFQKDRHFEILARHTKLTLFEI